MPSYNAAGAQALNQLSNLPFDNIIGGPLNAAINAQAQAAETTVDFIQSVGMREVNGQKEAINVQFVYEDSTGQIRRITVPILAIVPIPFIVIDAVTIGFKAKITASTSAQSSESSSQSGYVRGHAGYYGSRFRASLSAGYSAKKDSKASQESKYSVEYTMDVNVSASQAGLPAGMQAVLAFLEKGTHEVPAGTQAQLVDFEKVVMSNAAGVLVEDYSEFKIILTDANTQPILAASATFTSANDFLISTQVITSGGIEITMAKGPSFPTVTIGDQITDEITVMITLPDGETIELTKPITILINS